MRSTVSDQASVNKRLNVLFKDWRERLLQIAIDGFDQMSLEQKTQHATMYNFWCGLHFLVGLSEQASKTLGVWEDLLHGGKSVGAPSLPGNFAKAGECGSARLVRTVCKAIQDRGCEKAGKPVQFRDFIKEEGTVSKVPLVPFKGNRFNVLFHNAAGLYYLLKDLLVFRSCHKNDNKLFGAINEYAQVLSFQAGVRALGLVNKLVTGPLWRELEKDMHVLDFVPKYKQMCEKFKVVY
jgi:E1A/CREB-binding protein